MNGIDRFYYEAAYLAAMMVWLIENKDDHAADAEIADIVKFKPFFMPLLFDVMEAYK
jgi:hypothetical protein